MNPAMAHRDRPPQGDATLAERRYSHRWAVNDTFTTTGTLEVRVPQEGHVLVLKAWQLLIQVETVLAGSVPVIVFFCENDTTAPGPALAAFQKVAQPGEFRVASQEAFQGFRFSGANNSLHVGASASIGSGVIRVTGVVYGDEVVQP